MNLLLSPQQENVLNFIRGYIKQNSYPPTVREICKGLGLKSTSTVHGHLDSLRLKGAVSWINGAVRTLKVIS